MLLLKLATLWYLIKMDTFFNWRHKQGCIRRGDRCDRGVAPKFSNTLTLSQPGGQILRTIAEVEPKFSSWLRPCRGMFIPGL